jgi:hypothetical protein
MQESRLRKERIVEVLKVVEARMKVAGLRRKQGISKVTFYRRRRRYVGTDASEARGDGNRKGRVKDPGDCIVRNPARPLTDEWRAQCGKVMFGVGGMSYFYVRPGFRRPWQIATSWDLHLGGRSA